MSDHVQIPFLPGNSFVTNPRSSYHKSQIFEVNNGIRVNKKADLISDRSWAPTEPDLSIAKPSAEYDATQTRRLGSNASNLRRQPKWVAFNRKVLRFNAYFKEAVYSSPVEPCRVRKCVLYYYLCDDSLHIAEPKIENSGIPQGVFIKRHRCPKDNKEYVYLTDLFIGAELNIYGRVFRLVDADQFTREFYESNADPNNGIMSLGAPEDYPMDQFTKKHTVQPTVHNKLMHPMKVHMEASLGKMMGVDIEATQKFLKNDGKVLRFYTIWSDTDMYGEMRPYVMHYFLADDTIEVHEVATPNSGRDAFPCFLQRSKLPKDHREIPANVSRIGWTADLSVQYYTMEDFRIGGEIQVYGRNLFICGCDAFTKQFYMQNFGMNEADFPFISMDEEPPEPTLMRPPPSNGFGSEEDSLCSFLFLIPKIPRIDFKKLMENDGIRLSFLAKFVDPAPEDVNRRFNVTFFMNNDTVSIFERFQRNSGFVGGKFLERSRQTNEDTGLFFVAPDFKVGTILTINHYRFELLEADLWTNKFMQRNPDIFGQMAGEVTQQL